MKLKEMEIEGKKVTALEGPLGNANVVIIKAPKGYLMCGYLDIQTSEKLLDCAAIVRGVKTAEDVLDKEVSAVTKAASAIGVKTGMKGREALLKMLEIT